MDRLDGKKKQNNTDTHAMILIGCRRDQKNHLWLLLQNWWDGMEIVEVSIGYLKECNADIYFIHQDTPFDTKKLANPNPQDWLEFNHSLIADANNLDRPDQPDGCLKFLPPIKDRFVP